MTASPSPVSATPWLTLSIRLMAGGFLLFFGLALATLLLRLDQSLLDSDAGRLLLPPGSLGRPARRADSTMS
ncbi:membrane protein [Pseudomonas aeruginosa]|nr:membrane protein [Pseudomonas aeruginosa]